MLAKAAGAELWVLWLFLVAGSFANSIAAVTAAELKVGFGKVDITNYQAGPVADPLHARAAVFEKGEMRYVIISLDVVALERIGPLPANFLAELRVGLQKSCGILPEHVLVNTTHCHGTSAPDVLQRTIQAVELAVQDMEPVQVGVGIGKETRISQNRRLRLKNGREADYRHAYSLPPDEEIEGIGPIDPDVTVVKICELDGRIKGVLYQFACHPIQGTPAGGNTADITGYSSKVIEDQIGDGAVALFLQGCGGDINPIQYKEYTQPRDAESLGNLLALTVLQTNRQIVAQARSDFRWEMRKVPVPLADLEPTILEIEKARDDLVNSLQGTTLNFKEFYKLVGTQAAFPEFPSADRGTYEFQKAQQREWLSKMDKDNRQQVEVYLQNIYRMESITRLQTNLSLLRMHHKEIVEMRSRTYEAEVVGVKIGDFRMVTFPAELTVRIGLGLKAKFPNTPIAICGYSNGYIYYAPTTEQLANRGYAQEDSDCLLAPHWQKVFEDVAIDMLR
jgi:hypothetical protein